MADLSQDRVVSNNQKLYNNLLKSGKVTQDEIGDFNTFNTLLSDSSNASKLRDNLISKKNFSEAELGSNDDFLQNLDPPEGTTPQQSSPVKPGTYNDWQIEYDEANQKETTPLEIPSNQGKWQGIGEELKLQTGSGVNDITAAIYGTPGFMYDLAGAALRKTGLNVPEYSETPISKPVNIAGYDVNPLSILERQKKNLLDQSRKNTEKVIELNPNATNDAISLMSEGDIIGGLRNTFSNIARSTASSAAMMFGGGSLSLPKYMGASTAVFGSMNQNEADETGDYGKIGRDGVLAVSALNGSLEGFFERIMGSGAVGQSISDAIKKEGVDQVKSAIQKSWSDQVSNLLTKTPWLAPFGEAYEEMGTQLSQNIINKYSGYKPDTDIMDGVYSSGLMGAMSGAGHGLLIKSVQTGVNAANNVPQRTAAKKEFEQASASFNDIPNANYTEAVTNLLSTYTDPKEIITNFNKISSEIGVEGKEYETALNFLSSSVKVNSLNKAKQAEIQKGIDDFQDDKGNVTSAEIEGEKYYIKNSADLGQPGRIIFAKNQKGEVKPFNASLVKNWSTLTPDQITQTAQQKEAEEDNQFNASQEVSAAASQVGIEPNKSVKTPNGIAKVVSVNNDGTVTVVNQKGLQDEFSIDEVEAYKTEEQKQAEKEALTQQQENEKIQLQQQEETAKQEAKIQQQAIEQQSTETTPEQPSIPKDKDGNPDYDAMDPEVFFNEYAKEFSEEEAKTEIQDMQRAIIEDIKKKTTKKSKATSANERAAIAREIKSLNTRLDNINGVLQKDRSKTDLGSDTKWIAKNSSNPDEIVSAYEQEKSNAPVNNLKEWQKFITGVKFNPDSFNRFGDKNNITSTLAKTWLNSDGHDIDQFIRDNFEDVPGFEDVTEQDVIDFITENPTGQLRKTTDTQNELRKHYREITGVSIDNHKFDNETLPTQAKLESFLTENNLNDSWFTTEDLQSLVTENKDKLNENDYNEFTDYLSRELTTKQSELDEWDFDDTEPSIQTEISASEDSDSKKLSSTKEGEPIEFSQSSLLNEATPEVKSTEGDASIVDIENIKEQLAKLDNKRQELLIKVEPLVELKKKLYSNVDIESPKSEDEKQLEKQIASIFSEIQSIILEKRKIVKQKNENVSQRLSETPTNTESATQTSETLLQKNENKQSESEPNFRVQDKSEAQQTIEYLQSIDKSKRNVIYLGKSDIIQYLEDNRRKYSRNTIDQVKNANFSAFYLRDEIFINSDKVKTKEDVVTNWIHERVHAQTKETLNNEELSLLYDQIGLREIQRIIPRIYWLETPNIQADEYISFASEKLLANGKLDDKIPSDIQNIILNIVNNITSINNLTNGKNNLDNFQQGIEGRNAYVGDSDRRGTEQDRTDSEGNGVGSGTRLQPDEKGSKVTFSDQANIDLKDRHNAIASITKIGTELNIPVNVVNSSELTSDNGQTALTDNGTVTIVSDRVKSVSEVIKALVKEVAGEKGIREILANADPNSIVGKQLAKYDELSPEELQSDKLAQVIRKAFRLTSGQFSQSDLFNIINKQRGRMTDGQKTEGKGEGEVRFKLLGNPRKDFPKVRGGWTKDKIIRELKEIKKSGSNYGKYSLLKGIASYENAQNLRDHLFYHGTGSGISGGLYPSITMSERDAERYGGGGYGQRYFAVSVSKSKAKASMFSGMSRSVSVYPVLLNQEAKVIDRPDIQDSAELEDEIEQLWDNGVDAVRLGNWDDPMSEQELAVLNPYAISTWSDSQSEQVFGGSVKNFKEKTDKELEQIIDQSKEAIIKMAQWSEENKLNLGDFPEWVDGMTSEQLAERKQYMAERKRIREEYQRLKEQQQREVSKDIRFRILGETGASNLDKAEEATTRLDNLAIAREMEKGKSIENARLKFFDDIPDELKNDARIVNRGEDADGESMKRIQSNPRAKSAWADYIRAQEHMTEWNSLSEKEQNRRIRLTTGWEKGVDGKWRYETDDSVITFKKDVIEELKNNQKLANKTHEFRNLTYRKNEDGSYDFTMVKKGATSTSDIATYRNIPNSELEYIFDNNTDLISKVRNGEGQPGLIGAELDESATELNIEFEHYVSGGTDLGSLIENKEMFKEYPQLKKVVVVFDPKSASQGSFGKDLDGQNVITVKSLSGNQFKSTLLHEIQHAIQDIEGFARGGNQEMFSKSRNNISRLFKDITTVFDQLGYEKWILDGGEVDNTPNRNFNGMYSFAETQNESKKNKMISKLNEANKVINENKSIFGKYNIYENIKDQELYRRLAGEVESRNVQTRMNMSPEERRNALLSETEDVAREDQIVLMDGLGVSKLELPKTININGVERPTTNSKGQPIADSESNPDIRFRQQPKYNETVIKSANKIRNLLDKEQSNYFSVEDSKGDTVKIRVSDHSANKQNNGDEKTLSFVTERSKQRRSAFNQMVNEWAIQDNGLTDTYEEIEDILSYELGFDNIRFRIDKASEEVNTNPTDAQKEAGNYKKGHIKFDGFDISIENPKGSTRSGVDQDGNKWSNQMGADYGYIKGTVGKDKDHIDVFIGNKPELNKVYVVDQINPKTGNFDESKVMLGFDGVTEARKAYQASYPKDWKGLNNITRTTKEGLKDWFENGNTKKPFAGQEMRFRQADKPIQSEIGFYSPTEKALNSIQQEKGTAVQFEAMLLKNGAKQAELDWMGWKQQFPSVNQKVTKEDVQNWIDQNKIEVEEVVKGVSKTLTREQALKALDQGKQVYGIDDEGVEGLIETLDDLDSFERWALSEDLAPSETKYQSYQEPGGSNYKELLLTMPGEKNKFAITEKNGKWAVYNVKTGQYEGGFTSKEVAEERMQQFNSNPSYAYNYDKHNFKSSHFDEPNILAHIRFNEREVNGERVLFLEEIQSDWAQKGKKEGFKEEITPEEKQRINYLSKAFSTFSELSEIDGIRIKDMTPQQERDYHTEYENLKQKETGFSKVPDMPFKKTDQWVNLSLRRMMRYAAENGFDRIAWTNGEMQAARYDLSKQVDDIWTSEYNDSWNGKQYEKLKDVEVTLKGDDVKKLTINESGIVVNGDFIGESLDNIVGKEMAEKIINAKEDTNFGEQDLKIGGSGMKAFYDAIVPSAANKLGKPFGARVENIDIGRTGSYEDMVALGEKAMKEMGLTQAQFDALPIEKRMELTNKKISVQSLPVTDKMIESATTEGVPLFRQSDKNTDVTSPDYWKNNDVTYLHNPEPAPYMGARFGQDVEPSGKYVITGHAFIPEGTNEGTVRFKNPLIIDVTDQVYPQWKKELSERFGGKKKKVLTNAILRKGYDGIVTVENYKGKYDTKEIVILDPSSDSKGGARFRQSDITKNLSSIEQLSDIAFKVSQKSTNTVPENQNEDTEKAMNKAHGLKGETILSKIDRWKQEVKETTQHFKYVTEKEFPQIYNDLRLFESIPEVVKKDAYDKIADIVRPIANDKNLYKAFERYVVISDLMHDIKSGIYTNTIGIKEAAELKGVSEKEIKDLIESGAIKTMPHEKGQRYQLYYDSVLPGAPKSDTYKQLPFSMKSVDEVETYYNELREYIDKNPSLRKVIANRNSIIYKVRDQLIENNLMSEKARDNTSYFHHMVMKYRENPEKSTAINQSYDVRVHPRGWQKSRTGSMEDYNTDYLQSEFEVIAQSLEQLAVKKSLQKIGQEVDIMPALVAQANNEGGSWRDFVPEGYTTWHPKPGTNAWAAASMAEKAIQSVIEGNPLTESLNEQLAEADQTLWVIPTAVANQLDEMKTPTKEMLPVRGMRFFNSTWKQWILLNPARLSKYMINNFSGDLDIVFAYNPKILQPKYAWTAAKELYNEATGKGMSKDMREAIENAVISSGLSIQEIPDVNNEGVFKTLTGDNNLFNKYWNTATSLNDFREGMLRLAAYKFFKEELNAGKTHHGVSNPKAVDALRSNEEKAGKMARELLGDYGNLSQGGVWLRSHAYPFWSWMEINAPRYYKLLRNTYQDTNSAPKTMGAAIRKTAISSTALAARIMLLSALITAWNRLFFPDEDDELTKTGNRQLRLITGRRDDGSIITLRIQGAFSDVLSFVGLEDAYQDVKDVRTGKTTAGKKVKEAGSAFVNRVGQGAMPFERLTGELLTGKSAYPDILHPRPIIDRAEHAFRMVSLDKVYRFMTKKPLKKGGKELIGLVLYETDPGEAAYYAMRQRIYNFLDEKEYERPSGDPTEKSIALRYYKQAKKFKDTKLENHWLAKYKALGGTTQGMKTSIKKGEVTNALPREYKKEFLDKLDGEDREVLEMAERWYNETYKK